MGAQGRCGTTPQILANAPTLKHPFPSLATHPPPRLVPSLLTICFLLSPHLTPNSGTCPQCLRMPSMHIRDRRGPLLTASRPPPPPLQPARPDLHLFSPEPNPRHGPLSPYCRGPKTYQCLAGMPTFYQKRKLKNKICVTGHFNIKNVGRPLSQARRRSLNRAHAGSLELNCPSCRCRGSCTPRPSPPRPWSPHQALAQPLLEPPGSCVSNPSAQGALLGTGLLLLTHLPLPSPHCSPTIVGTGAQPGQN